MKLTWIARSLAVLVCSVVFIGVPRNLSAQDQVESKSGSLWSLVKEGKFSGEARYRFEAFERDGAPFTEPAYAPTLRIALGYETPAFHVFSVFAEGAALIVTGPADYSIPTVPYQNRPNRPAINDPKYLDLNQGYLRWTGGQPGNRLTVTLGRQEIMLNDGRFITISTWRQDHQNFDAARLQLDLPRSFSFTYAYLNRVYRVVGHDATDGRPPMHSHLLELAWTKPIR